MNRAAPGPAAKDRLVTAAFELFATRGFDATTVDEIARRAGVGRTTFFRLFATKEAVIFPPHAVIGAAVEARLASASADSAEVALSEAACLVLRHYMSEGDIARSRYALTSAVPALRDVEIASQQRYQHHFGRYLRLWFGGGDESVVGLRAEVLAGAIVSAHNHILREWLQGRSDDVDAEKRLDAAIRDLFRRLMPQGGDSGDSPENGELSAVVLLRSSVELNELLPALRQMAKG